MITTTGLVEASPVLSSRLVDMDTRSSIRWPSKRSRREVVEAQAEGARRRGVRDHCAILTEAYILPHPNLVHKERTLGCVFGKGITHVTSYS